MNHQSQILSSKMIFQKKSIQELQKLVQSLSIIAELTSEPYDEEIRKLVFVFMSVSERVQTALEDAEDD